jgi:Vitamin K-dependent gamma-carboxylase
MVQRFARTWNQFFFAEQSPLPIALFRIFFGVMVMATLVQLRPDWLNWYGVHSWVTNSTARALEPGVRLNLFAILPQDDRWINALFWVAIGSAFLLTVGLFTRINSVLVFVCLASIQQRNLYITHGGDTYLRVAGFFLMFAPAGAALSVDHLIRRWRGKESSDIRPRSPWAQRMIQIQLTLVYLVTFLVKIKGQPWLHGTALFYIYHLDELRRFPVPAWLLRPAILRFETWLALALEFCLGVLIWVRRLRYPILGLGAGLHLWLDYSLNIPLFQWDILSAYVLFVDPDDILRVWKLVSESLARETAHLRAAQTDGHEP